MLVYRIAKRQYIYDLSGEGARLYGGRWNRKGTPVVYTSGSRSLATVEYLVHLPQSVMPLDICMAEIEIPDPESGEPVSLDKLPPDWRAFPAPLQLAGIGEAWVRDGLSPVLKVPSAVIKDEWNYLLNPRHPLFRSVRIASVEDWQFDPRLLDGGNSS
jgi:RES domain-containing protein